MTFSPDLPKDAELASMHKKLAVLSKRWYDARNNKEETEKSLFLELQKVRLFVAIRLMVGKLSEKYHQEHLLKEVKDDPALGQSEVMDKVREMFETAATLEKEKKEWQDARYQSDRGTELSIYDAHGFDWDVDLPEEVKEPEEQESEDERPSDEPGPIPGGEETPDSG